MPMKTPRITSGFSSLSDANFENKAGVINSCMTGNPYFPVTTPAMPVVTTAVQDYSTSLIAAKGRDKNAVAIKNQRRIELNALLVQLANSVMAIANGDRTMLISSGFDLVKDAESIPLV